MVEQLTREHPPTDRARPGIGRLTFKNINHRSIVTESFAASPLKFIHPQNHGNAAWAVCGTYGGGLLGGDDVAIEIDCQQNSRAVFSTQASTKIYRSEIPARQSINCRIRSGALFVSAPDRVACFAGSSLDQVQRFSLDPDANLIVLDWLSAGRLDSGERWQFDHYRSRIEVLRAEKMIFRDTLLLDSRHGPLPLRMSRFNTFATLVITGPQLRPGAQALLDSPALQQAPAASASLRLAASPLGDDGIVLRCASDDVETLGKFLRGALNFVCDIIGDDPWARRW